jgi:uncharacterized membrane protein YozB (DUF420 family)
MLRQFIRTHVTLVAIIIFIVIFTMVQMFKPLFLYNQDGSIRSFGIGYKNKTILPIWLLSIILGIVCYLAVIYYVSYSKLF